MVLKDSKEKTIRSLFYNSLVKASGRALHRIGIFLAGIWIGSIALDAVWPVKEILHSRNTQLSRLDERISLPNKKIFTLLIGLEANEAMNSTDNLTDVKDILLIEVMKNKPIKIMQIPVNMNVNLPFNKNIKTIADAYQEGGILLTTEIIMSTNSPHINYPHRYIVVDQDDLAALVARLDGIKVNNSFNVKTKSNEIANLGSNVKISSTLINGEDAKNIFLGNESFEDKVKRFQNIQLITQGLINKAKSMSNEINLTLLINDLLSQVETNLTKNEFSSLVRYALLQDTKMNFQLIKD